MSPGNLRLAWPCQMRSVSLLLKERIIRIHATMIRGTYQVFLSTPRQTKLSRELIAAMGDALRHAGAQSGEARPCGGEGVGGSSARLAPSIPLRPSGRRGQVRWAVRCEACPEPVKGTRSAS